MSAPVIAAGILSILFGLAHSYVGERRVVAPLCDRSDLPPLWGSVALMRGTIRFAWHLTSIAWIGIGALLVLFAPHFAESTVQTGIRVIAGTFFVSACAAFLWSRGRHPAWAICLVIAIAAWFGSG
jgi:hypothetical protein